LDSAVSMVSASFHLMQCSLRDPRLLSLFDYRKTRPLSFGVSKKLGRAAALPKWSARAELGQDAALADAVAVDCVLDLIIRSILRVPDLTGAVVLSGTVVLAGAVALVGAGAFLGAGVLGAGCSSTAGVAWPAEAGAGSARISGTSGALPLSMPALLVPALASSVVPAPLEGAPVSEASCWAPVSIWKLEAEGFC
jgi:hypothetical protein